MDNSIIGTLDVPFKEFTPGQIIQSKQINDDMIEIEETVNTIIAKHNGTAQESSTHIANVSNPHGVTASQVGAYSTGESDAFIIDLKNGNLNDGSVSNRVLATGCIDNRTLSDYTIEVIKVVPNFGEQLDIGLNLDVKNRYTKSEVDDIIISKVGSGTYTKEQLDLKFSQVQVGQIVDNSIPVEKLAPDVGDRINIISNPALSGFITSTNLGETLTSYAPLNIGSNVFLLKRHTQGYIGTVGELTVDTTNKVLRLHDGITTNGIGIINSLQLQDLNRDLSSQILELQSNLSTNHNHSALYAPKTHTHTEYIKNITGLTILRSKLIGDFEGMALDNGSDSGWVRTTKNGLLPYQSGVYSSLGTSSWRFSNGFFSNLNSSNIDCDKLIVRHHINFSNDDYIDYDDTLNEFQFKSDNSANKSRIKCGHIELNGVRIYIGSEFPTDARTNDILIQV